MSWIKVSNNFSVFSVREEFNQFIDWILYFIGTFWVYFLFAIGLSILTIVLVTIMTRLKKYSRNLERK